MTRWWDTVLDDPVFIQGMGRNLSLQAQARRRYEAQVDKTMKAMHLPSRQDGVRLSQALSMLEERLLSLEDRLLELEDGRSLRSRLDALDATLQALSEASGGHGA